jgi:hypothetical protein
MSEDQMWLDIGPEKTALLKRNGFDIVKLQFVQRVNRRMLGLAFVRDTPLATLRAELRLTLTAKHVTPRRLH